MIDDDDIEVIVPQEGVATVTSQGDDILENDAALMNIMQPDAFQRRIQQLDYHN